MSDQPENKNLRNFAPSEAFTSHARVQSHAEYRALYEKSLEEPEAFWRDETSDLVWREPWKKFSEWKLDSKSVSAKFFLGGVLNLTESCLDRHLSTHAREKAAIVFEGEPGDVRTITYFQLHHEVVRMTAALATLGVKKGTALRSTWAWFRRRRSRCSPARVSVRRTRWCSADFRPTRFAIASMIWGPRF